MRLCTRVRLGWRAWRWGGSGRAGARGRSTFAKSGRILELANASRLLKPREAIVAAGTRGPQLALALTAPRATAASYCRGRSPRRPSSRMHVHVHVHAKSVPRPAAQRPQPRCGARSRAPRTQRCERVAPRRRDSAHSAGSGCGLGGMAHEHHDCAQRAVHRHWLFWHASGSAIPESSTVSGRANFQEEVPT